MKIIIDTNLWVSFTIGKRLVLLSNIVRSEATVIICKEIVNEYLNVCHQPKFHRYITEKDIEATLLLMDTYCEMLPAGPPAISSIRDVNDLFLLSLADSSGADYLLTGDNDLLVLEQHNHTRIIDISTNLSLTKN